MHITRHDHDHSQALAERGRRGEIYLTPSDLKALDTLVAAWIGQIPGYPPTISENSYRRARQLIEQYEESR